MFIHDSSEEKMWAKYSDMILAQFFSYMNLEAEVLGARGSSADILAKTSKYTIVADAKTFRLSRTAKNQKDFKVQALDNWRQNNNYSVLASPLFQYPCRKSQIYSQAIQKNVTLISYLHLKFILDSKIKNLDLEKIWNAGKILKTKLKTNQYSNAQMYWAGIDKIVCDITDKNNTEIAHYKKMAVERLQVLGKEGIQYWKKKIREYQKLPKEKAIQLLIKAHKINNKILQIKKAINISLY